MDKELNTALQIYNQVNDAIDSCESVKSRLNVARGLGIWDIFGGGMMASILKRSKMEDANQEIRRLRRILKNLKNIFDSTSFFEFDADLEFDDLSAAFDIFFDNIFSDLSAQKKINDTLSHINDIEQRLKDLLMALEDRYSFN